MNLALNARDAMPNGGHLTIETANIVFDEGHPRTAHDLQPGAYAQITVTDTGTGMDTATLARLFEPFFTTKDVGQGTGLGLATVHGIVTQSGGAVWASSEPGQGASFTVCFPQVAEAPEPLPPLHGGSRPFRGSETILLVEDEDDVRGLIRELLAEQGYQVLEARHGLEALALAGQHAGLIHLLLTDVVMPHMGGPALAHRLTSARQGVKVVYMSGYSADAALEQDIAAAKAALIPKPILSDSLLEKVRHVLDTMP